MKQILILLTSCAVACAPAYATPTQRMADAQSAHRSAQEAGASEHPDALLHLKLAEEGIAKARTVLVSEENRRADFLLIRAKADAELALALAKEQVAKSAAREAVASEQEQTNLGPSVSP